VQKKIWAWWRSRCLAQVIEDKRVFGGDAWYLTWCLVPKGGDLRGVCVVISGWKKMCQIFRFYFCRVVRLAGGFPSVVRGEGWVRAGRGRLAR
jgi:hypothetical protein